MAPFFHRTDESFCILKCHRTYNQQDECRRAEARANFRSDVPFHKSVMFTSHARVDLIDHEPVVLEKLFNIQHNQAARVTPFK